MDNNLQYLGINRHTYDMSMTFLHFILFEQFCLREKGFINSFVAKNTNKPSCRNNKGFLVSVKLCQRKPKYKNDKPRETDVTYF